MLFSEPGVDAGAQPSSFIINNPVEAGIAWSPEDYVYSSASNYQGGRSQVMAWLYNDNESNDRKSTRITNARES